MGTVFKKQTTRALPAGSEIIHKGTKRIARWRVRGKLRTAEIRTTELGLDRIVTESSTYYAKYRDHNDIVVTRATGCRDEQAARQMLSKWLKEVEQIRAGTLDATELESVKLAAGGLDQHFEAYNRSLLSRNATTGYRANVQRALRRIS